MDISGNLILVESGGFSRLVEFSKFLRRKVDTNENLRLIDLSKFPRF